MQHAWKVLGAAVAALCLSASGVHAHSGPFDGKTFKGRIAFSSDGNFNDEDDWGAFPVAVAILDAFGVTLVPTLCVGARGLDASRSG